MALKLDSLTIADATLPTSKRGRTATPIPAALIDAVKASYNMPKDSGKSITVPANDADVKALKGFIRRAADSLGYGVSIADGKVNKTTHEVLFRAKVKNKTTPKPTDIYVADDGDSVVWVESDVEGARLASVGEARSIGFVYDDENGWTAPAEDDDESADDEDGSGEAAETE